MPARVLATVATLLGVAYLVVLRLPGLGPAAVLIISNGGQLAAAVLAAVGCAIAARRTSGHRRTSWWWLCAGIGAWAAGQAVYSYYEVVLGVEAPFPSFADVGFLTFPLIAGVGLVILLGTQADQLAARGRDLFDGAIIAGSLLLLSWVTTLGTVVENGDDSTFALLLSLAYPLGDVVLGTLVLIALTRSTGRERITLGMLALGLGGLALSDSAFVYATSTGAFSSASLISSGWTFGFLYVAAAGLSLPRAETPAQRLAADGAAGAPFALRIALPYVPVVAAGSAVIADLLGDADVPTVDILLGTALVVIVLARQFLAMLDNERLMVDLGTARDQLQHQALHDALTGLANRVLFADRLDRALIRPGADIAVMYCDLDDFKLVNDQLGHGVGDEYLVEVAHRLLSCVRTTDTVARLGGDEFAILLEDSDDPDDIADRVVDAVSAITHVGGHPVHASISVGLAKHSGGDLTSLVDRQPAGLDHRPTPSERGAHTVQRAEIAAMILRSADSAMYAAKGAGKSRAVLAGEANPVDALPPGARVISHH